PESDVINLLDFLTGDPQIDAALARQLANTMNKNFKLGATASGDPFFDNAGDQLVQAVMMLAKQMPSADLMTAQVILAAPQLVDRLFPESSGLDPWIRKAWDQIFSVKDSEKTVSSIIGTATLNFTRLMMAKILACCIGNTTLPLDIDGKQLIVFGLDREIRDVVSPIVATAIHMMVNRNLFRKGGRKDPLYVCVDEMPTLYLPQWSNWENESRSDGFNGIWGFQNKSQLEKIYGKELALAMMGGSATKFIFNPGEVESAEYFSKFFGDEEIARKNKSRSTGGGGKPSTSTSIEVGTRKLVSPEEFICLPPGTCYMTNPAYSNDEMSYLPRRIKVNLPPWELELAEMIEKNWEKVRAKLIKRASVFQRVPTEEDVRRRMQEFDAKFPIPKQDEAAPDPLSTLAGMF
ncbi:MAG: type IV secretory system conjugative DNA transfer family protein, partial [Gammaproteobacteria bacterium]